MLGLNHRCFKACTIALLFCLMASAPPATSAELPKELVSALKATGLQAGDISVYVQALGASPDQRPPPLIAHLAQKPLNPASTMKLLTSIAALDLLGPNYRWKTEIYYDGKINQGTLDGTLYLKGYGDPQLLSTDMWRLVSDIRHAGIRNLNGNIVIDNSYFATTPGSSDQFDGEGLRAYNVLPNAMLVNHQIISFRFIARDGKVDISPDPDLPNVEIINHLKTRKINCQAWRSQLHYAVSQASSSEAASSPKTTVTFSGDFPQDCTDKYLELALLDNPDMCYQLLRQMWLAQGGEFSAKLSTGVVPATAYRLLQFDSDTLANILRDINKWSNNVMARQLLLTIAAEKQGAPATTEHGIESIQQWLKTQHLDFAELVIDNGAGLSRNARISAEHLGQLLTRAYESPIMPELMASLPIVGVDGTMQSRLLTSTAKGQAHIKTGSLNGVFALAGYALATSGKRYVLVFMINHAKAAESKPVQDALIEWVINQ